MLRWWVRGYSGRVLVGLRDGLRSGDIFVPGSRRHADPASFLLTPEAWAPQKVEFCHLVGKPVEATAALAAAEDELHTALVDLETHLAKGNPGEVRLTDDGELIIPPLTAEDVPAEADALRADLAGMLPRVPIASVLVEVDARTRFTDHLVHAGGKVARPAERRLPRPVPRTGPLLTRRLNLDLITDMWDDLPRAAGGQGGHATAALVVGKLCSSKRQQNALTSAIKEYGALRRTVYAARYLADETYRRSTANSPSLTPTDTGPCGWPRPRGWHLTAPHQSRRTCSADHCRPASWSAQHTLMHRSTQETGTVRTVGSPVLQRPRMRRLLICQPCSVRRKVSS